MTDSDIIELYFGRDEQAIAETDKKYGRLLNGVSVNILGSPEDAQECVNDTYSCAWNAIPPARPEKLCAWLCRTVRNISYNLWKKLHTEKRGKDFDRLTAELDECVPAVQSVEQQTESRLIAKVIDSWLGTLPDTDRRCFVRRYFMGEALGTIAESIGKKPADVAQKMHRLRLSLKAALEKEDIIV